MSADNAKIYGYPYTRVQALSKKSTDKLAVWAMANEKSPLAEAYFGACTATTFLEQWGREEGVRDKKAYQRALDMAWDARHSIGRMILDRIKTEGV